MAIRKRWRLIHLLIFVAVTHILLALLLKPAVDEYYRRQSEAKLEEALQQISDVVVESA